MIFAEAAPTFIKTLAPTLRLRVESKTIGQLPLVFRAGYEDRLPQRDYAFMAGDDLSSFLSRFRG